MDAELKEYLKTIVPNALDECHKCGRLVAASVAFEGKDGIYCSETCKLQSEALLIKRRPEGLNIGGWDL